MTDNTREEVKIKEVINITGVLPCDVPNAPFFHGDGELFKQKLEEILGPEKKNVVAWFKYKKYRKFGFKFSIREKVIHEQLTNYFQISPCLFTCCLLTTSQSSNKSVQIFSHAFVNMPEYNLKMVPMHIENLGDTCHVYQPNIKPSDAFMKVYKKLNKDQSDFQLGQDIHESLKSELEKSVGNLRLSEVKLWILKKEVEELNNKLRKLVLASNPWPITVTSNIEDGPNELEIEVPLSPDEIALLNSNTETVQEDELNSSTTVVDLTLSDEEEDGSRKKRLRDKRNEEMNKMLF